MFLVTSTGWSLNEKLWVEYLRNKQIDHVLILRFTDKYDPMYLSPINEVEEYVKRNKEISKKEADGIIDASKILHQSVNVLNNLYIPYEYHEFSKSMSKIAIMAYLAYLVASKNDSFIIDISHGERLFIPLFLMVSQMLSERIKEFISLDPRTEEYHDFPFLAINPDPDQRSSTTIKDILSLFVPMFESTFQKIPGSIILDSNQIINLLLKLKPSHIKARLQHVSTPQPGKPSFLNTKYTKGDRRKYEFSISETGLLTLYINYLRYKYILTEEDKNIPWFDKVNHSFDLMNFNDVDVKKKSNY